MGILSRMTRLIVCILFFLSLSIFEGYSKKYLVETEDDDDNLDAVDEFGDDYSPGGGWKPKPYGKVTWTPKPYTTWTTTWKKPTTTWTTWTTTTWKPTTTWTTWTTTTWKPTTTAWTTWTTKWKPKPYRKRRHRRY